MSVLETPRLYFSGKCTWDPIVTNNTSNYWDIKTSKPTEPLTSASAYREEVDDQIASHRNWNPQGTHRSVFYETYVNGIDSGGGLSTEDALVKVPVKLNAMLVDIDPYVSNSSQLFFDELKVGINGGPQIRMPNNGPLVGRYINFRRNRSGQVEIAGVASVVWQASCMEALQIAEHDSGLLRTFKEQLENGDADGLTVRINAYRTSYFDGPPPSGSDQRYQELENRVKGGGFQPNPARSLVVGVVGLHRNGEPLSMPSDRQLSGAELGTAFARLDKQNKRLVVDLANSIPEVDYQATKQNLGEIAVSAGGQPVAILNPEEYDKAAYEATAGIVSFDLDDSDVASIESGDLKLSSAAGPRLGEQPLRAVVHPPNLYIEGTDSKPVIVQVLRHGDPVSAKVKIRVSSAPISSNPSDIQQQIHDLETDDDGKITIHFSSQSGARFEVGNGASQWIVTPYDGNLAPPAPNRVNTATDCYVAVRVTPADDDIAALDPTWENVHQQVLIDWEALAPCMDNWLKLGDEDQCRSIAPLLKRLTSLDHFDSFTYMPVTRGLSKGQRTLLHNWCDAVTSGSDTPPKPRATVRQVAESSAKPKSKMAGGKVDFSRGFSNLDDI